VAGSSARAHTAGALQLWGMIADGQYAVHRWAATASATDSDAARGNHRLFAFITTSRSSCLSVAKL